MNPEEVEYLGENQLIQIIPRFTGSVMQLIKGDFGPFRLAVPVQVPLWMAVMLKKQQKCDIVPPEWLNVDFLETVKTNEKSNRLFTKMPSEHYMIEAKLLLDCASDDLTKTTEIRTIVKDIWDIRMAKLRSSMDELIKSHGSYAAIDNLTPMEINAIRVPLTEGLDQIHRIQAESAASENRARVFQFLQSSRLSRSTGPNTSSFQS